MRFLVFGATGMAGHMIAVFLRERGHEVVGFSRRKASFVEKSVIGDACNTDLISELLSGGRFDVAINCIGILNRSAENDPASAAYINGEFPHVLARLTEDLETRVFHLSTDCVFSGNTGPYTERSVPDGGTVYDRTKAMGELVDSKNFTLRCSIVGPDIDPDGIGLLNWFMAQKGPVPGYTAAIWTGLTTLELAKAIECSAREDVSGLVNMVPPSSISKFDLLRLFNEHLRGGEIEMVPDGSLRLDKTLVRTNFGPSYLPKGYPEQVAELSCWIRRHSRLYPHYCLDGAL